MLVNLRFQRGNFWGNPLAASQDFLKAYQEPEHRPALRRARRVPGTVSGRTPKTGTMWMSSTLGGASGAGWDPSMEIWGFP